MSIIVNGFCGVVGMVLAGMAYYCVRIILRQLFADRDDNHVRGRRLISHSEARTWSPDEQSLQHLVPFGGVFLPEGRETEGFVYCGSPGSGKTVLLRHQLQWILHSFRQHTDVRFCFLDAKQDLTSWITWAARKYFDEDAWVILLNAFDRRCTAWDVAKDVTNKSSALEVATGFLPPEKDNSPYFINAARHIFAGVLYGLHIHRPGEWTLADAIHLLMRPTELKNFLLASDETRHYVDLYFDAHSFLDVMSTLATKIAPLEAAAEYWKRASNRISISQWITSRSILILSSHDEYATALAAINRGFLNRLAAVLLTREDSEYRRTWLILDEFSQAGRIDTIPRLLSRGRSKGVASILTFQDISLVRDTYGHEFAEHLVSQAAHLCLLRQNGAVSAKWAADTVGENEEMEAQFSQSCSHGQNGSGSESVSWHRVRRPLILPSEFQSFPPVSHGRGITGAFIAPHVPGTWVYTLPYNSFPERPPASHVKSNPDFLPQETSPLKQEDSALIQDLRSLNDSSSEQPNRRIKKKLSFKRRRTTQ